MNSNIFNKALDSMLEEAAKRADKELGEQTIISEEDIEFSKKHERKMKRLFAKADRQRKLVKIGKYSRRAACVLIIFGLVGGVSLFSVKALRYKVLNFVFDPKATHTDFEVVDSSQTFRNDYISIGYLPEGFALTDDSSDKYLVLLEFKKGDKHIRIDRYSVESSTSIDTENSTVSDIKIRSLNGKYINNPRFQAVVWYTDEQIYSVFTNISKEETIRVAESVTDR